MQANQYIQEFLVIKSVKAKKTYEFYRVGLKNYLDFAQDNAWPPSPTIINQFIRECQRRCFSSYTTWSYFRAVATWVNWLHRNKIIRDNPIDLVEKPPKPRQNLPRAPDELIVDKFFEQLEMSVEAAMRLKLTKKRWRDVRDLAIFSIMLGTGMRIGEVSRIEIGDIDFTRRVIRIPIAKDRQERDVLFSYRVKGDIRLWLDIRKAILPQAIEPIPEIFISYFRGRWRGMTASGIRQRLEKLLRVDCHLSNDQAFTPHQLRHAFAVQVLENEGSLEDIRTQFGHEDLSMVGIYTRLSDKQLRMRHDQFAPR